MVLIRAGVRTPWILFSVRPPSSMGHGEDQYERPVTGQQGNAPLDDVQYPDEVPEICTKAWTNDLRIGHYW